MVESPDPFLVVADSLRHVVDEDCSFDRCGLKPRGGGRFHPSSESERAEDERALIGRLQLCEEVVVRKGHQSEASPRGCC